MTRVYVIGIGYRPFDKRAREIILESEIILASDRLFDVFRTYREFAKVKSRVVVINNVDETIGYIKSSIADHKASVITLLASGDPLFFGIGRRAVQEFGEERVEIMPDLSSIQRAFSRIQEAWDDALLISLHGGPDPGKRRRLEYEAEDLPFLTEKYRKVAVLTDKVNDPAAIAKTLIASPGDQGLSVKMYVCEKLGYPDERISAGTPEDIAGGAFESPNVVVLINTRGGTGKSAPGTYPSSRSRKSRGVGEIQGPDLWLLGSEVRFGLEEDEILHTQGLITRDEVRAVAIHKLRLPRTGLFWDIGAGSGSVAIEVARLCPGMKVFAIEKDEEQVSHIRGNRIRFDVPRVEIIRGTAPEALRDLPRAERVFIGGSDGKLGEIMQFIAETPAEIVVIHATRIETLITALAELKRADFVTDVTHLSASREKHVSEGHSLTAINPVFLIRGVR